MIGSVLLLPTTAALVAVALLALIAGPLPAADPPTVPVEDWAKQAEGKTGTPDGGKGQNWGSPKYDFRIVTQGDRKPIQLKSANNSSTISKELKVDVQTWQSL